MTRTDDPRPNIIWIMSDDLAWADCGCYGQRRIQTPNIDALAAGGLRFTQCYSGSTVCAPSRSSLMQGLHQGHATVRANMLGGYRHCLQPDDVTVADVCKSAGYATGLFGKWGLSNYDQPGTPNAKGFDEFCGYLNQRHAHNYYPTHIWKNDQRIELPQHEGFEPTKPRTYDDSGKLVLDEIAQPEKARYTFDIYAEASREFVRDHADDPFFLYLAYTPPHGKLVVPDLGPYADLDWPSQLHKEWAAMVTYMDTEIGRLVDLLKELDLLDNTLIFFCSDNGYSPMDEIPRELIDRGVPTLDEFFHHRGPFKGGKGDLHEGGLRVPMIAHWPAGITQPGVCDHPWAFWDLMPTAAELAQADCPTTDGISIVPTLTGQPDRQQAHEFLYWEFWGAGGLEQSVRIGDCRCWKAGTDAPIEVYDIVHDGMETENLARARADLVQRAAELMESQHAESAYFPNPGETMDDWKARAARQGAQLTDNIETF